MCFAALLFSSFALLSEIPPGYATFEYFSNPHDCLGLKDYRGGVRVAPDLTLLLPGKRSIKFLKPHIRKALRFLEEGYLPILHAQYYGIHFCFFTTPIDHQSQNAYLWPSKSENFLLFVVLENLQREALEVEIGLRNFGKISCKRSSSETLLVMPDGKVGLLALSGETKWEPATLRIRLEPLKKVSLLVPAKPCKEISSLSSEDFPSKAHLACKRFWKSFLSKGSYLYVPERKARDLWYASIVGNFISRDLGTLKPGEGFYDSFYLRDGAFQLIALACAGFIPDAQPSLKDFFSSQKPDGRFESQRGELDGNGQALWALWRWWTLTRDRSFLKKAWPACSKSFKWIQKTRKKEGPPFEGILPRSLADGECLWRGDCHIVGYDFWNLRGVACVAEMAKALGKDPTIYKKAFESYKRSIEENLRKRSFDYFPPSYEGRGTSWGNLTFLYPKALFDPDDPRITKTLELERKLFVEGTITWRGSKRKAIHPYLSTYITQSEIIRKEKQLAVDHFYHFLCHSSSTNALPEGVYWERRTAWNNTLPHQWASAQYILLLRNMLIREEGDTLHLLSVIPNHWLEKGKKIVFKNAPTSFGKVSFVVKSFEGSLSLRLTFLDKSKPKAVFLHLPPNLKGRVKALGEAFSNPVGLPPSSSSYLIEICGEMKKSKRFEEYAKRYLKKGKP